MPCRGYRYCGMALFRDSPRGNVCIDSTNNEFWQL